MLAGNWGSSEQVAQIVRQCLNRGKRVDIDGLGTFVPDPQRGFRFVAKTLPKVFLAYVQEDANVVDRLYDKLTEAGFDPWMDRRKLLPGQNWPSSIEDAIDTSDFFIGCFSQDAVKKKGGFQAEIRYALDCARRVPLDEIFLIPIRLNDCHIPVSIRRELQYIDLFPEWERGFGSLIGVMHRQVQRSAAALRLSGDE